MSNYRPGPKPKPADQRRSERLDVTLTRAERDALERLAAQRNESVSSVVRAAVQVAIAGAQQVAS